MYIVLSLNACKSNFTFCEFIDPKSSICCEKDIKDMPFDFYLISFPFFVNFCIFTHLFDFACHANIHELLKAQQATAIVTPLKVSAVAHFIRLIQKTRHQFLPRVT